MDKYKQYLPSRKFLIILSSVIIALVLIVATKTIIGVRNAAKEKVLVEQKKDIALREQFLALDSDNDGLKDWEESLWKTDSKVSDTDKDGTSDGEEIKAYRDPLKAGPGDEFDPAEIAETKKMMDEYASLNETEIFSRTIFANFLSTQQINSNMSESDVEDFVANAIETIPEKKVATVYTIEAINVSTSTEEIDLDFYKKGVEKILNTNLMPFIAEDINTFEKVISENDNAEGVKSLEESIKQYRIAITSLIEITVPDIYTGDHLVIINSLGEIISCITDIKDFSNNPIISMFALNLFPTSMNNMQTALQNLGLLSN